MRDNLVVITGAGRGIGRALALQFAREKATVVICSRTEKELKRVEEEIKKISGSVLSITCDIGVEEEVERLIKNASQIKGTIDILINNAGVAVVKPAIEIETYEWEENLKVNLTGAFLCTKHALRFMRSGGQIINILSIAAKVGFPNWSAYCASKFGLLGFANALREELRPGGIKVTSVIPGAVDTELWDKVPGEWDRSRMIKAEDVAKAVVILCKQPQEVLTEEVVIGHISGAL